MAMAHAEGKMDDNEPGRREDRRMKRAERTTNRTSRKKPSIPAPPPAAPAATSGQAPSTDSGLADSIIRPAAGFPIVGIGASAGGLAAFEAFFSAMPADTESGMAFVLVQHLA